MGYYFADHLSMFAAAGSQVTTTLDAIVRRYVGNNPPLPMVYRAYSRRGILRVKDYRYSADFDAIYPNAKPEQFVYAWSRYWSDGHTELKFDVSCLGPMVVHLNGQIMFKSDIFTERYPDERHRVALAMQPGWNHMVIRFKKTGGGFGGTFGTWLGKHPYYFLMPTENRAGQEGWIFTEPLDRELGRLPGPGMTESDTGVNWRPQNDWPAREKKLGQLRRIFGKATGAYAVGRAQAFFPQPGTAKYTLRGTHKGPLTVLVGTREVFRAKGSGKINANISIPFGRHDILVRCSCSGTDWGFALELRDGSATIAWESPCAVTGIRDPWIYAGPFPESAKLDPARLCNLNAVIKGAQGGETYWRVDMPDGWLRPYNENALYGRWNYPLGVTLYGLLHSAAAVHSPETQQYILNHMQSCCDTFHYALWDKAQYGGATAMHTLLSSIDSLDDCGSFGSAMLEVAQHFPALTGYREIADYVADYISNKQARLPDGTFYRKILMHIFHKETMWADDLYMSVPFLCRYARLTGKRRYLDDAARQFLGFKKRLYIPQLKVMSHIFDFRRNKATGVPWGRGNGWTIFSLSELLAVLPKDHALRPELLEFFRDLCAGYLKLQDANGMWHQVLTHPDAYPETSCTAMFAYAFARGIRFGWLTRAGTSAYSVAVFKAWQALNQTSIDKHANIHGVCRGSEFSFSPEYYKKELLPNLNDTHGIGIVLLAGVEVLRLTEHLAAKR